MKSGNIGHLVGEGIVKYYKYRWDLGTSERLPSVKMG